MGPFFCTPASYVFYTKLVKTKVHKKQNTTEKGPICYQVTQLRTVGVHYRESTGTRPVVLKVVPVTGAAYILKETSWAPFCAPLQAMFFVQSWEKKKSTKNKIQPKRGQYVLRRDGVVNIFVDNTVKYYLVTQHIARNPKYFIRVLASFHLSQSESPMVL